MRSPQNNTEIERKWLIDKNFLPKDYKKYPNCIIEQAYLVKDPSIRVRKNNNNYFLTIKSHSTDNGLTREEYELNIDRKSFNNILKKCDSNIIKKRRYKIPYQKYIIELDIFSGMYKGLIYAEVEFKNIKEAKNFKIPDWFGRELTADNNSTNTALAFKKIKK